MWRTKVIHHKNNYYSKGGFQYMNRRIQRYKFPWYWANDICRTKRYSAHQKELTQNSLSWLNSRIKKSSKSHANRKKKKQSLMRRAGCICGKTNRLIRKKQAKLFYTSIRLMTLGKWRTLLSRPQFPYL